MKHIKRIIYTVLLILVIITPNVTSFITPATTVQAASITISKKKLSLEVGATKTLKITGSSEKVSWSSSDKTVATVSSKGKVTAKETGNATITASVDGMKLTCKVTVIDASSSATKK